jgi:RNA polymerase-associated protein CTR9
MNTGKPLETDEQQEFYREGTKIVERVFKKHNKNAAASNILSYIQLQRTSHDPNLLVPSMKLAERTIQFADTLTILNEGHIRAARAAQAEGSYSQALSLYTSAASRSMVPHTLAVLGQAQIHIQNDENAAAIHALDVLLQKIGSGPRSLEASVMLASLRSHPRPGVSSSETASERRKARDLYDKVQHSLASSLKTGPSQSNTIIARDTEMYVEIARLWQGESLEKVTKATLDALKTRETIDEKPGMMDSKLFNNLGALKHLEGNFNEAMSLYERALTIAISQQGKEGMETSILYNLARVYEDQGESDLARDAYDKLLSQHPEYIDAKLRLVHMLQSMNKFNDAHILLKQCLTSQISNTNLRAFYTHFLIQTNSPKAAKDFVFATLRDYDKHDLYALCAAGFIQYNQCRESRDTSAKGVEERKKGFHRAAELFDKALSLDPMCAVAAQGLAIITAEDALVTLSGLPALHGAEEAQRRLKLFLEALDVFSKVRESIDDGSVYANMGHCYYSCDEFDRAIEHYETASDRYHQGQNPSVLLCLCRSWYAKANKDQSHSAMSQSLKYAQKALYIRPGDKAVLYNIATIQQKIAQMLFSIPSNKRTMADLRDAVAHAEHAQALFASLANDKSDIVPYSRDIADQRQKFGDTLLRRKEEQLENQRSYEQESHARLAAARQKRQEEKDRLDALERARLEAKKVEAEKLAEERRKAREEAQKWTKDMQIESDDERERRASKKVRKKPESGDEGANSQGEPKKKRKTKLKKADGQDIGGDLFSDDEEVDKQAKKRTTKKRVVRDEEDEAVASVGGPPRKKQFKSKEVLSDTDDEMDQD